MQDILGSVQDEDAETWSENAQRDVEAQLPGAAASENFMKDFFEDVSAIKADMSVIRRNLKSIEDSYLEQLLSTNTEGANKEGKELEELIRSTEKSAKNIKTKLRDMHAQNKNLPEGTADHRIRVSMHGTLTRKFLDLMSEYQEVQTKHKNKYREKFERQYKLVDPEATQEKIETALQSGEAVFEAEVLGKRNKAAQEALAYVEQRHRDVLNLEKSIKELHQLFVDMAILVEAQGELIEVIEHNVDQSKAYTKKSVQDLAQANKYQKKSRRNMCILIGIIAIVGFCLLGGGGIAAGVAG